MSDPREPPRPPPHSTMQVAGQAVDSVVNGLKSSPMLLGLVLLNIIGIAAAVFILMRFAEANQKRFDTILKACLPHAAPP